MAKKCGDCIHAELCERIAVDFIQEFSRENIAYCKGFQDRTNYVEVVWCKDCKHYARYGRVWNCSRYGGMRFPDEGDFCSYGERREVE